MYGLFAGTKKRGRQVALSGGSTVFTLKQPLHKHSVREGVILSILAINMGKPNKKKNKIEKKAFPS